ncbi:MAG: DUF3306 domain-containing protein [Xanthobacteraceae bacterium]
MNDPDNFVARWSRRKRDAAQAGKAAPPPAHDAPPADDPDAVPPAKRVPAVGPAPEEPAFDLASLPPIESITAETDIRAFLAPGVPAELRHAALRRAWSADPAIRDFIGLVENGWDFNDPASIGGFGTIQSTADLARDVARIVGDLLPDPEVSASDPAAQPSELSRQSDAGAAVPPPSANVEPGTKGVETGVKPPHADDVMGGADVYSAPQQETEVPENLQLLAKRRGHGRALPE